VRCLGLLPATASLVALVVLAGAFLPAAAQTRKVTTTTTSAAK